MSKDAAKYNWIKILCSLFCEDVVHTFWVSDHNFLLWHTKIEIKKWKLVYLNFFIIFIIFWWDSRSTVVRVHLVLFKFICKPSFPDIYSCWFLTVWKNNDLSLKRWPLSKFVYKSLESITRKLEFWINLWQKP